MQTFHRHHSLVGNDKPDTVLRQIRVYQSKGLSLIASSSFQTQSLPLLHILSQLDDPIPIVFINTGYLFPETLDFRDHIVSHFGLRLREIRPAISKSEQRDSEGQLLYVNHPDRCCDLNKVAPMERVLAGVDIWISGVRSDQTSARRQLQVEQPGPNGVLRVIQCSTGPLTKSKTIESRMAFLRIRLTPEGLLALAASLVPPWSPRATVRIAQDVGRDVPRLNVACTRT